MHLLKMRNISVKQGSLMRQISRNPIKYCNEKYQ